MCIPKENENLYPLLSLTNSKVIEQILGVFSPTLDFHEGPLGNVPVVFGGSKEVLSENSKAAVAIAKNDWDSQEISWGFSRSPLIDKGEYKSMQKVYSLQRDSGEKASHHLLEIEEKNNRILIEAYGLEEELSPDVPLQEVTLTCNPHYRYGGNRSEEELETLLQCDTIKELVSYGIGCMMGRYSLDKPGLILASQGETVRDYLSQIPEPTFAPDKNAIIPLTDQEWFPDDATNRFRDFVRTVWVEEHLQENLDFVAESLCLHAIKPKKGEAALETIRRYLSTQFYKDHLRTYKKRPIYWLFSSGKQKAFECLVYLHRYNESTLAEMRTNYVIPLTTKLASYVEKLEQDKDASTSAAEAKRIEKELSKLYKQQAELNTFDEKLRHYADQRISLDLDDGVKVNYGKFGDLLAEVKVVTGKNK
ncbi:BREX-1 system adenine-specific DNA-methyltransferase PglX [Halomonas colorata]|uniref:BREX-1 system adenine-specific DNA-methyltransferase PglX n=1 Tax=Halomonas colorata TaxID=2742615 RepID=UPI001CE46468|nr:BREX-1 system adenine-specific DNA-methyltransferase PglX [Halomonas colorata]